MNIEDALKQRKSIRTYTSQPVELGTLESVLELAGQSPSWANTQCWETVIVQDRGPLDQLAAAIPERNPGHRAMLQAPACIVLCAKPGLSGCRQGTPVEPAMEWHLYDLGIFSQSFALACLQANLGTVTVGIFDRDKVTSLLQIPEDIEVATLHPVGYFEPTDKKTPRKAPQDFIHRSQWNQKPE